MSSNLHRILFATDFSPCSRAAFAEAQALAKLYEAELCLLHVVSVPSEFDGAIPFASGSHLPSMVAAAEQQLKAWSTPLVEAHLPHQCQVVLGDAGTEVLRLAEELKPDLIVVGTHGRTGLKHLFLGSVAERVVRMSRCPVLVVPDRGQRVGAEATDREEGRAGRGEASPDKARLAGTIISCTFEPPAPGRPVTFSPAFTVDETEGAILVTADLPGVEPSSVRITIFHGEVTVSGERLCQPPVQAAQRRLDERGGGTFSRSFPVPLATSFEHVQAGLHSGVLSIRVDTANVTPSREAFSSGAASSSPGATLS